VTTLAPAEGTGRPPPGVEAPVPRDRRGRQPPVGAPKRAIASCVLSRLRGVKAFRQPPADPGVGGRLYVLRVIRSCGVYEELGISHAVAGNRMRWYMAGTTRVTRYGKPSFIPAPRCDRHCHGRLDRRRPAPSRRNSGSPDDVRLRRPRETHDRSWPPSQSSRTPDAEGTRHFVTARMAGGGGVSATVTCEYTKAEPNRPDCKPTTTTSPDGHTVTVKCVKVGWLPDVQADHNYDVVRNPYVREVCGSRARRINRKKAAAPRTSSAAVGTTTDRPRGYYRQ
jgi:hypothetical protein